MERFAEYLYRRLAEGLLLFENPHADDIYILSLYIDFDSGPHRVKLWLYFNTNQYLRRAITQGEDPAEARWNFALWEQDYITALGLSAEECTELADDQFDHSLVAWLKERDLYRDPEQIERLLAGPPGWYDEWDRQVRDQLLDLFVSVARELQETGLILAKFGRSIPLLIHEWEYGPWTLEATRVINPLGLTGAFEDWFFGECLGG